MPLTGDLSANSRAHIVRHTPQWFACRSLGGKYLMHTSTFEIIQVVKCPRDACAHYGDTVTGHKHHIFALDLRCDPLTFAAIQGHAVIVVIVGNPIPKAQRILIAPGQAATVDQGERGGVRHMAMQHAFGVRVQSMNPTVNEKRGRLQWVLALQDFAVTVDQQDVAGADFAPM